MLKFEGKKQKKRQPRRVGVKGIYGEERDRYRGGCFGSLN